MSISGSVIFRGLSFQFVIQHLSNPLPVLHYNTGIGLDKCCIVLGWLGGRKIRFLRYIIYEQPLRQFFHYAGPVCRSAEKMSSLFETSRKEIALADGPARCAASHILMYTEGDLSITMTVRLPTAAFLCFFRTDYMVFPDCSLLLLSTSVSYFLVFLLSTFELLV